MGARDERELTLNLVRSKFPSTGQLSKLPTHIPQGMQELAILMNEEGRLKTAIKKRNDEINEKMIYFENKLKQQREHEPESQATRRKGQILEEINRLNRSGHLTELGGGGGAYGLEDKNHIRRFVIKPNDQDSRCLNNKKHEANLFLSGETSQDEDVLVRPDLPLYESVQNEALAYDLACLANLEAIAPCTLAVILENPKFYSMTEEFEEIGNIAPQKRKLCSAQEYVPHSDELSKFMDNVNKNKKFKFGYFEIDPKNFEIDQDNFESANIFTWLTGNLDGHLNNYLICYDRTDASGHTTMRLKKIDNGLMCGDGDRRCIIENGLNIYKPSEQAKPFGRQLTAQMGKPLSRKSQEIILNLPIDRIVEKMRFWEKSPQSIGWTVYRIQVMQTLVRDAQEQKKGLTLNEMNEIFEQLSLLSTEKRALINPLNIEHLESLRKR